MKQGSYCLESCRISLKNGEKSIREPQTSFRVVARSVSLSVNRVYRQSFSPIASQIVLTSYRMMFSKILELSRADLPSETAFESSNGKSTYHLDDWGYPKERQHPGWWYWFVVLGTTGCGESLFICELWLFFLLSTHLSFLEWRGVRACKSPGVKSMSWPKSFRARRGGEAYILSRS